MLATATLPCSEWVDNDLIWQAIGVHSQQTDRRAADILGHIMLHSVGPHLVLPVLATGILHCSESVDLAGNWIALSADREASARHRHFALQRMG